MSRLTRDGTAEPVSRDQVLRRVRGQGNFPCSADLEQDWQPYPVDPYSAIGDDHTPAFTDRQRSYRNRLVIVFPAKRSNGFGYTNLDHSRSHKIEKKKTDLVQFHTR